MYGKIRYDLTKEEILKRVSYWDLWSYYIPKVQLKKAFLSPLRNEDIPSASLFVAYDNSILMKDFGKQTYTIWSFLQEKYNLSYIEVLLTINNDFDLKLSSLKPNKLPTMEFYGLTKQSKINISSASSDIKIKKRKWNEHDKLYWDQYYLDFEFLFENNVIPLQNFWVNDNLIYWYNQYNPAYSYEFINDKKRKIYSPFNKKYKFCGNASNDIWQGEDNLEWFGKNLIITKAYKDALVLKKLNYQSIAPQSESCIFDENKISSLSKRFENIYLLYDNDKIGTKYSIENSSKYTNLIPIFVPPKSNCKDISDFISINKIEKTKKLLKTLIK